MKIIDEKNLPLEHLISHKFSIDEWEKAFEVAGSREGLKVIIHPDQ